MEEVIHFHGHETAALLVLCLFVSPLALVTAAGLGFWFIGWLDDRTGWMTRR